MLDASVALAWCLEDEAQDYAATILDELRRAEAIVPQIWTLEVSNVLVMAERGGGLEARSADQWIRVLLALPIAMDPGSRNAPFQEVRRLARAHRLSVYDATYLELAVRLGLPLATLDPALRDAADREGVPVAAAADRP